MSVMKPEEAKQQKMEFYEVEVKFRFDEAKLNDWKQLISGLKSKEGFNYKEFVYVDSDDIYYTKTQKNKDIDYEFIRYRFSDDKKDKRAELTTKRRISDSNNIVRKEWNVRVDGNDKDTVEGFIVGGLGYEYNFRISKYVQIYKFEDATLPFYTVIDEKGRRETFIEIEVDEKLLHKITNKEAWDILAKYEDAFAPLGITPRNRVKLSLFEMYKKK